MTETVRISAHFRWWAKALLWVAVRAPWLVLPIGVERFARMVTRGIYLDMKPVA
jgi:hypothetical protein